MRMQGFTATEIIVPGDHDIEEIQPCVDVVSWSNGGPARASQGVFAVPDEECPVR